MFSNDIKPKLATFAEAARNLSLKIVVQTIKNYAC